MNRYLDKYEGKKVSVYKTIRHDELDFVGLFVGIAATEDYLVLSPGGRVNLVFPTLVNFNNETE